MIFLQLLGLYTEVHTWPVPRAYFIFPAAPWAKIYFYFYFINKETEEQGEKSSKLAWSQTNMS